MTPTQSAIDVSNLLSSIYHLAGALKLRDTREVQNREYETEYRSLERMVRLLNDALSISEEDATSMPVAYLSSAVYTATAAEVAMDEVRRSFGVGHDYVAGLRTMARVVIRYREAALRTLSQVLEASEVRVAEDPVPEDDDLSEDDDEL